MKKLKRFISMIMAMATSAMLAITANAEGGDLASSKAVTGTKESSYKPLCKIRQGLHMFSEAHRCCP